MPKVEETKVKLVPSSQGGTTQLPGRWSSANLSSPLQLEISTSFDGDWAPEDLDAEYNNPIEQAMKSWNDAHDDLDFFEVPAASIANKSSTDLSSYHDSVMGIYKSTNWFPGISSDTLAITQFYGYVRNSGTNDAYIDLTHADIIVNYRDHLFSTNPGYNEFDIQTVVLHEMGHFIGLKHPDDYFVPAVMQATLGQGQQKRTLLDHDKNALITNYNGYNPNLTENQAAASGRDVPRDGEEVSGYYELRSDGLCLHWLNGKLIDIHH